MQIQFQTIQVGQALYRVPMMNFNKKPFNGERFDNQVLRRAEMWRSNVGVQQEKSIFDKSEAPAKKKADNTTYTHMLTVPLSINSKEQQDSFKQFRETVLQDRKLEVYQSN